MGTIVVYTDHQPPQNAYPGRIVSPTRSGPCCFSSMDDVGSTQQDGRWLFQYRRCRQCGFTVRTVVRELPDAVLIADLRKTLATAFTRNVPDL